MSKNKGLEDQVKDWIKDWSKKIDECKKEGHKEPINLPYAITNHSDSLRDKGLSYCKYCGLTYERFLTGEEIKRIHYFFNVTMEKRMTI